MSILDKVKPGIDLPMFERMKDLGAVHAAGSLMCCDHRNGIWNDNGIYQVGSTANLFRTSEWYNGPHSLTGSLALAAFAIGGWAGFTPAFGMYGVIGAGSSTDKIVTSTALQQGAAIAALGLNQLVKTDMPYSYMIRVSGKTSGKVEQRTVVANTASATPVIYLDEPLSFTPAANDTYQILSGIVYIVAATTTAAGQTRAYGVCNNALTNAGALGITTATAAAGIVKDETFVPFDMETGEGLVKGLSTYDTASPYGKGYLRCLIASATSANSITGGATLIADEYRNFQIRIVEDTVNPTAVDQRVMIKTHTGGASPVFTTGANWGVTPSANAKFVIEYPNVILLQSAAQAGMLTYNYSPNTINNGTASITAFTWSATYFNATHAAAVAAGCMAFPSFAHQPKTQSDGTRLTRHSYDYFFRGSATTLDLFDMAGAANGLWTNAITYNNPLTMSAGSSGDIDNYTFDGEYAYINLANTAQMYQFNIAAPSLVPWVSTSAQSGTAVGGQRVCILAHVPSEPISPSTEVLPEDKLAMIYVNLHLTANLVKSDIIV